MWTNRHFLETASQRLEAARKRPRRLFCLLSRHAWCVGRSRSNVGEPPWRSLSYQRKEKILKKIYLVPKDIPRRQRQRRERRSLGGTTPRGTSAAVCPPLRVVRLLGTCPAAGRRSRPPAATARLVAHHHRLELRAVRKKEQKKGSRALVPAANSTAFAALRRGRQASNHGR